MPMRIDQAGLSVGVPGRARNDGLSDGSEVTLTDTTSGGSTTFQILWVSPADSDALSSLTPDPNDSHIWRFTPTAGVTGPIRIRLIHTSGSAVNQETRIFGIPDDNGVVTPAPGERSDPNATRLNATDPAVIARCERNWPTEEFPSGNPFGWGLDFLLAAQSGGGGGGGGDNADVSVAIVTGTAELLDVGRSYIVFPGVITMTLPDARTVPGRSLSISFLSGGGQYPNRIVRVPELEDSYNFFFDWKGNVVADALPNLTPGTYEFRALYAPNDYPYGFWIVRRLEGSLTRRAIDVDYCLPDALPPHTSVNLPVPSDRYFLRSGGGDSPAPLPREIIGTYDVGSTILIPFDEDEAGMFRVNQDAGPNWELELLEKTSGVDEASGRSQVEYRIRGAFDGIAWGGRSFQTAFNTSLRVLPTPLSFYPNNGIPLDGSLSAYGRYKQNQLLIGKVNMLDLGETGDAVSFELVAPTMVDGLLGERFAIKVINGVGTDIAINMPDTMRIESVAPPGTDDGVVNLNVTRGSYVEWMLFRAADSLPIWQLVTYLSGGS